MKHLSNCGVTPLDLIAGLKHSGKTSLINALLRGPYRDQAVSVFTNELGNTDYAENARVHTVLGGCICCTAQAALIAEIRNALRLEVPDHLIVELSGQGTIRDLLSIRSFLSDCQIHQLIYVLNARKFQSLATVMGSGFSGQIQAAPVLFLNHWAALSPAEQAAVRTQLHQWNPVACLLTDFGEIDSETNHALCRSFLSAGAEPDLSADLPRHTAFRSRPAAGASAEMKAFFREKASRQI